jgi:hypothetical protein
MPKAFFVHCCICTTCTSNSTQNLRKRAFLSSLQIKPPKGYRVTMKTPG